LLPEKTQFYRFDEFRLDVAKRQLLRAGEVVPLYSKAFDLLLLLVESAGRDLGKNEILETIWPGQILEESNLTVNISAVRRALGEKASQPRFLVTIPGRGYRFVARVEEVKDFEDGFTIESQTISEIIVEEEIREPENPIRQISAPRHPGLTSWQKLALATIAMSVLLAFGSLIWIYRTYAGRKAAPFQRISIKRLTTKGTVSRAAISPDGKLFVYSIPEGNLESLWLGHVDGGEPIQIRPTADQSYETLRFTPDGSGIYFSVSDRDRHSILYKMPVFGGAPEKLHDKLNSFSFSPDGKQFAFLRFDGKRKTAVLMRADASGGNEQELATMPVEISSDWYSPAWSPDGLTIAVAASQVDAAKIFLVSLADRSTKLLTEKIWRDLEGISWLKDGRGLVCVGIDKSSLHAQVWFVSVPGGETRQVITDLNDYGYVTSLSDDNSLLTLQGISEANLWVAAAGNLKDSKQLTFDSAGRNDGWNGLALTHDGRIVFAADDSDGRTLWIMNATGGRPKQLIPNGGLNSYPSVTSDGRYLVFQSNRSGHFAIWRSDLDGANMVQVTGDQPAGQPTVSPDGRWILYNSSIDSLGELFRIPLQGGEPFRLTDKPVGWALISPDSKSIACEIYSDGKAKLAILSIDGGDVLKSYDLSRLANPRLGVHWTPDGQAISYRDWVNGIWRQKLDGGEPQRLEGLPAEKLFSYGWSPDGKLFAFSRGTTSRDVVLIKSEK
jgi:Tol biopolymer transport system component/DNA-binding winged helix-turn-helix (wHTH) protein